MSGAFADPVLKKRVSFAPEDKVADAFRGSKKEIRNGDLSDRWLSGEGLGS